MAAALSAGLIIVLHSRFSGFASLLLRHSAGPRPGLFHLGRHRSPLLFRHSSPLTLMALGVAIYFLYLYIWILPRGSSGGFPAARPVVPLLHSTKKQKMKTFFLNSPSLSTTVSSTNYFPALPAPGSVWVSPRVCPIENARWGVNRLVLSLSVGANKAGIPHTDRVDRGGRE